jgi:CheY-like chemotaxis protein
MHEDSILVSEDSEVQTAFAYAARQSGMSLRICEAADAASALLRSEHFDVITVDCDDTYCGAGLLKSARESRANRRSVVLAILNDGIAEADALDMGANLVCSKPISPQEASRQMAAARFLSGPDLRKHPRLPVEVPVYLSFGDVQDRQETSTNIGIGGIGVRLAQPIDDDEVLRIRFRLPSTNIMIQAIGEITWADSEGRVGIRFLSVEPQIKTEIQRWVADSLRP